MTLIYFVLLCACSILLYTGSYCINWHILLEERRIDDPCSVKYSDWLLSGLVGYLGFSIGLIGSIVSALFIFR